MQKLDDYRINLEDNKKYNEKWYEFTKRVLMPIFFRNIRQSYLGLGFLYRNT